MAVQPHPEPQFLCRRTRGRVLCGVAGGLADYLMVDPLLTRLTFVGLTLLGGAGVLLYLVLALVLPVDGSALDTVHGNILRKVQRSRLGQLATLFLFGAGALLLGRTFGWSSWGDGGQIWPLTLMAIGLSVVLREERTVQPEAEEL